MTYRDIIFVLCFVALGAWCWAGPITTPEPQETPLAESAPLEKKKQPKLTPTEKKTGQEWVHPKLALKLVGKSSNLDDLVLGATLLPRSNSLSLEMATAVTPRLYVTFTAGDKQWNFNSPLSSKTFPDRAISETKTMDWKVPMTSLEPDRDITELKALFGKKDLDITMEVFEAGKQNNPMSRQVYISIQGATSVPASE